MISSQEFKKQISKHLAGQLKQLGFKGSGFHYLMDAEKVVFAIGLQANQYGGSCCAEFGIQPKGIERWGIENPDLKKIKYYDCVLRTRLSLTGGDKWWKYSDNESGNIRIANEIIEIVRGRVLPVIQLFKDNPNFLETLEPNDLTHANIKDKFLGMPLESTDTRLAWVLSLLLSKSNPAKAKAFAIYGLSKLESTSPFIGRKDFEQIIAQNNG